MTFTTGEVQKEYDAWRQVPDASGYRLPTEAEWAYACRAGTVTSSSIGTEFTLMSRYAVFDASKTEPVGSRIPNGWGLFDVHGNVWEWCQDWYAPSFRDQSEVTDPVGPPPDPERPTRVDRGASFWDEAWNLASWVRLEHSGIEPHRRSNRRGFRIARNDSNSNFKSSH